MDAAFDKERNQAEVFDALSHPTRILILKALTNEPLGFAELKKKVNIESSGHLQHHLTKLGDLVKNDAYGKYILSDQGKDALRSVETVERVAESETYHVPRHRKVRRNIFLKIAIIALAFLLATSATFAYLENSQVQMLQNKVDQQSSDLSQIKMDVQSMVSQLLRVDAIEPLYPHYLAFSPELNQTNGTTKIYLVSAAPNYQYWTDNDTTISSAAGGVGSYVLHYGDPIFSIFLRVRNDYAPSDAGNSTGYNAPIGNYFGSNAYVSFVILQAQLYSKNGSLIKSVDVTQPMNAKGGFEFSVLSGTTTPIQLLFSIGNADVDHYEIYVSYLSATP